MLKQKGGNSNYSSASTYGRYIAGSGNQQFDRVFGGHNNNHSNQLTTVQGGDNNTYGTPNSQSMKLIQSAGRRRKKRGMKSHKKSKKRGGFMGFGSVATQAVVPFGILGLQQTYRRKKSSSRSRRTRRR